MTKKDYIALANALRSSRPLIGGTVHMRTILTKQWETDVLAIAHELMHNPRFDYDKFVKACGVYS